MFVLFCNQVWCQVQDYLLWVRCTRRHTLLTGSGWTSMTPAWDLTRVEKVENSACVVSRQEDLLWCLLCAFVVHDVSFHTITLFCCLQVWFSRKCWVSSLPALRVVPRPTPHSSHAQTRWSGPALQAPSSRYILRLWRHQIPYVFK